MKDLVSKGGRGYPLQEWGSKAEGELQTGSCLSGSQAAARLFGIFDLSGSMAERDAGDFGNERRVDVLKNALEKLVESFPGAVAGIGFNDTVFPIEPGTRMEPGGMTCLHKALVAASASALSVKNVVLVSDGQPTDGRQQESKEIVRFWAAAGVKFNVIHCGPEGGMGERFLQELAMTGGGSYSRCQVKEQLLLQAMTQHLLEAPTNGVLRL